MSINWVMLARDGGIVPIHDEKILHTSRGRVGLELTTPRELQIADPFTVKSDSGIAYITNQRLIYLPARPTEDFKSFSAPVLNFSDTHAQSSWIGPWSWGGMVKPVAGGGIPMHIPRIEARFTFREGGHSDFQSTFETLKERLLFAREMGVSVGANLEPPPPYDPNMPGPSASSGDVPDSPSTTPPQPQSTNPSPDEPPPDYLTAQTQAVSMQYEQRMRDEAERQ